MSTKKPIFRRQFNPGYTAYEGEKNTKKSVTVPDMSLTVHQLLQNHSRGIFSDIKSHELNYFDAEIPRYDDITDAIEHKNQLKIELREIEDQIAADTEARKQAAIDLARAKAQQNEKPLQIEDKDPSLEE